MISAGHAIVTYSNTFTPSSRATTSTHASVEFKTTKSGHVQTTSAKSGPTKPISFQTTPGGIAFDLRHGCKKKEQKK